MKGKTTFIALAMVAAVALVPTASANHDPLTHCNDIFGARCCMGAVDFGCYTDGGFCTIYVNPDPGSYQRYCWPL